MAVTIHRGDDSLVADEALYVTRDGRLVSEDDPEANELVSAAGRPISPKLVKRYGIKATGKAKPPDEEPKAAPAATEEKPTVETKALGEDRPTVTSRPLNINAKGK